MHFSRLIALIVATLAVSGACAQVVLEQANRTLTIEGYANLTAAQTRGEDQGANANWRAARADGGVRFLGLIGQRDDVRFGARAELLFSKEGRFEFGQRSLLLLGAWGRAELGKRRGLPDVLAGYAPNGFTFTSAEFGLASGPGLDPGGSLPTLFLPSGVASRINSVSSLGFSATFATDRSTKLIYVSPRARGFEGGVSYSPRAEELGGRFRDLLQTGLVHETYFGENTLHIGATYTQAKGSDDAATGQATNDLKSISGGASLALDNALEVGLSATWDGRSGLAVVTGPASGATGFGHVASINYNSGPWTLGAFYQQARTEGDPAAAGVDGLRAWQAGASYRVSTRLRFFAAYYRYAFRDEGGLRAIDRFDGGVLLFGTRVAL